jgi:hypothetical protein
MAAVPLLQRREVRREVQMLAHLNRGGQRSTVMLKDLTCGGARIEGIAGLQEDEAVALALPGCKPSLAFVAWAGERVAGLEFAVPFEGAVLEDLILLHAMGTAASVPQSQIAAA